MDQNVPPARPILYGKIQTPPKSASQGVRGGRADGTLANFVPRRRRRQDLANPRAGGVDLAVAGPGTSPPPSEVAGGPGRMPRRPTSPPHPYLAVAVHFGSGDGFVWLESKTLVYLEEVFRPSAPSLPDGACFCRSVALGACRGLP